jgi:hypothetical protein
MKITFFELLKSYGLLILYLSPFITGFIIIVRQVGKQNAKNIKEYDTLYARIGYKLGEVVTYKDSESVRDDIRKLKSLKHKNSEKTEVIEMSYLNCLRQLFGVTEADEFGPEQLDADRVSKDIRLINESTRFS